MAEVKRLRTQVFNKPVGVVRADAGDDLPGRAIASAATSISNMAYREAAYRAEERGQEAALAEPSQNIVTLDPETGLPVAFGTASSYGSIAARSFENMVNRRFEESVNNELEERGREIAQQAGSAAAFRDQMSEYVSEMYSAGVNEAGEFNRYSRYIQETGTEYVASTYETLRQREVAAARAALARQQQIDGYRQLRGISHLITSGNFMEAATAIDAAYARNEDLLNSGSQTPAQWNRRYEELEALQQTIYQRETDARASRASTQLHRVYAASSEEVRAEINMVIANPGASVSSEYHDLVVSALSGDVTPATLRTSLDVFGSSNDSIIESVGEQYFAQYSGQVSGDSTPQDIDAMIADVPQLYQSSLSSDLLEHSFYLAVADLYGTEAPPEDVISFIQNAIQRPIGRNLDEVANAIGEGGRGIADRIVAVTDSLTQEERDSLSQSFDGRRQLLNRITGAESRAEVDGIGASIRQTPADEFLVNYSGIVQQIEESDLLTNEDRNSLLRNASRRFVASASSVAGTTFDNEEYSPGTIEEISLAIQRGQADAPEGVDQQTYAALRDAHGIERTTIQNFLSDYANSLREEATQQAIQGQVQHLLERAQAGDIITGDGAQVLQDYLFPDGTPQTAFETFSNQAAMDLLRRGTVLPFMQQTISNAAFNGNEDELGAALAMFQIGSRTSAVLDGGGAVSADSMLRVLPRNVYALLNAATMMAETGVDPTSTVFNLREVMRDEDSLNQFNGTIRGTWELPSNAPLRNAFIGMNISLGFQDELVALAQLQTVSRGTPMPVEELVEFFVERRGMSADANVVGPRIGDNVLYARSAFLSRTQQAEFSRNLQELLVQNIEPGDVLEALVAGGDSLSAQAEQVSIVLSGFGLGNIAQRLAEAITSSGTEALDERTVRDRIRIGLAAIDVPIRYQPIPSTFDTDDPTYLVGYEDANGMFAPFTFLVNGTEETVTLRPRVDIDAPSFLSEEVQRIEPVMGAETRDALRRITIQNQVLVRETERDGNVIPNAWRYHMQAFATYEHNDERNVRRILGAPNRDDILTSLGIPSQLSNDDIFAEYLEMRQMYESLPDGD